MQFPTNDFTGVSSTTVSGAVAGRIAVVGRPNVGKSTLFNVITDSRKAVVRNEPGVTRDVQIETAEWCGNHFEIVDTGGLTDSSEPFAGPIRDQVRSILRTVHGVIFVVDSRSGLCPEDRDAFRVVAESGKPFLVCANKSDNFQLVELAPFEFAELGVDILPTSFEQRAGMSEILEWIISILPQKDDSLDGRTGVRLTIVGKPNVGKSSLCNRLLGESRMIVSDVAGTTVDAIDSQLERDGRSYVLTDTAGLRRKSKQNDGVEVLAGFKSREALRKSDLVLLVIDGLEGPSDQDSKMIQMCVEDHKGMILVVNKLDRGEDEREEFRKKVREQIESEMHFFPDIPIVFISAKTGAGIDSLFRKIDEIWEKLNFRVSTSELNDFFQSVIRRAPAPVYGTKNVKFYYLTQTKQRPPSFIAFANSPDGVHHAYRRFLVKQIKERWDLEGIPIRIFAMKKGRAEGDDA